ncbi:helix-turn-helix domain-containing protein (plasmid) [Lactococcus lactis subsp. lactis]|uniref:Rgg/GadR/MutR family transcriptional regulator n=1 Tax=Lactococcus lactis TaxID=1358 RepID=UPI00264A0140|nr:Rgg/GadR/MutR family transcriptional regulator [Lactococcus lactis]WKB49912.1 helix-turn-helix domain-containing protein [Lactococcus lactis subsp. lactis]
MKNNLRYGLIFKQLRNQKKLPLSFFEKLGVRKSSLSKFERGTSMMSFERICLMLEAMDVSVAEYQSCVNNGTPLFLYHFLFEVELAERELNLSRLEDLLKEVDIWENVFLFYIIKSKIEPLKELEIAEIVNYLLNIKTWVSLDLALLQCVLFNLDTAITLNLVKKIENQYILSQSDLNFHRKIMQIRCDAILLCCLRGDKVEAEQLLDEIVNELAADFYISNLKNLVSGAYTYYFENYEIGLYKLRTSLEIFESLGSSSIRSFYAQRLKKIGIRDVL